MNSNETKAAQLGMPLGTATHKLRKSLLFKYVKLANAHFCFKCKKEIQILEEFSIEHKKPWLYISTELFWDLDNIAFSHIQCNRPDRPTGAINGLNNKRKIIPPKGFIWCNRHKEFLPIERFSNNKSHWTGKHTLCKECQHYNREEI